MYVSSSTECWKSPSEGHRERRECAVGPVPDLEIVLKCPYSVRTDGMVKNEVIYGHWFGLLYLVHE